MHSDMKHRQARTVVSKLGVLSMCLFYLHWLRSSPGVTEDVEPWPPPLPPPHRRLTHLTNTSLALHPSIQLDTASSLNASSLQTHNFTCPKTDTDPEFFVCVYSKTKDKYISASLLSESAIWEPFITDLFQRALQDHPNAVVIDIGANVGYYSLLAAEMGHRVLAIEPSDANARRLLLGARLNNRHRRVTLLRNAVYDRHINVSLTSSRDNQGGVWITKPAVMKDTAGASLIRTIVLDDVIPLVQSHQAILKIDIEGFECRALSPSTSSHLFTKLHIPFVFMEWQKMFVNMASPKTVCSSKRVEGVAAMLANYGYIPYEIRTGFELDPGRAGSQWKIGDVYWRHQSAKPIQNPY